MRWQRQVVAVFVAVHVSAMVLLSIPRGPAEVLRDAPNAEVERAVARWRDGYGPGFDHVEPSVRTAIWLWAKATYSLATLYGPYTRFTGSAQGWTMFGTVPTEVERFEVWAQRDGEWTRWYAAGDERDAWRRGFFENERIRTFIHGNAKGPAKRWDQFAEWTLGQVSAEDPEIDRVKVQFVHLTIPPPAELARTGVLAEGAPFRVETRRHRHP